MLISPPNNCTTKKAHAGFTLLEVLIALSIFAIMGLASYHLLSGEVRTQTQLEKQSAEHNSWQRGMMRLTQDLQQIIPRTIREDYGDREPALKGDSDSLSFTRQGWNNPLQRSRSDLQRVHYQISRDDDLSYLSRHFWPHLDRAPGSEPIEQKILLGVDDLKIRYYHVEDSQWLNQWPPLAATPSKIDISLPQAIEITLSGPQFGEVQRLITLTTRREGP